MAKPAGKKKGRGAPRRAPAGKSEFRKDDVYEAEEVEAPEERQAYRFDVSMPGGGPDGRAGAWDGFFRAVAAHACRAARACTALRGGRAPRGSRAGRRRARPVLTLPLPPRRGPCPECSVWTTMSTSCPATLRMRRLMRTWPSQVQAFLTSARDGERGGRLSAAQLPVRLPLPALKGVAAKRI